MTTIAVHTTNPGWLEHPDSFAHVGRMLGVAVLVQSDPVLHDHEYRVYGPEGPISRTTAIDQESGKRIRATIEKHLAHAPAVVDKPQPRPEPMPLQAHGNQITLF